MDKKTSVTLQSKILLFYSMLTVSCNSQQKATPEQQKVINQTKANFVFVEGGTFVMGNNNVQHATEHKVTLDSYSISKYETTWEEFDLYHILNGKEIINPQYRETIKDYGPKYGAKKNTWYQAKAYCKWLGAQLKLPLDLPTEAQWEYAARSRGLKVEHATDSGKIEGSYTEKRNYNGSKVEVGTYAPNPLGLYDMSGGRPEWTNDWLVGYDDTPLVNPRYDSIHIYEKKMVRGWHKLRYSVYSRKGSREPNNSGSGVGFRCVCNQKKAINK